MADQNQELRDAVIRTEEQVKNIAASVDKLTETVATHVQKTSESIRDLHTKVEDHKESHDDKFVRKETHEAQMNGFKRWLGYITAAIMAVGTAAVTNFIKD